MNRLAALYILIFSFLLFAGCSPKAGLVNTTPSTSSVQNDTSVDSVPTEVPTDETEKTPSNIPSEATNETTPVQATALPADPSLETPAAKEAIEFFDSFLCQNLNNTKNRKK